MLANLRALFGVIVDIVLLRRGPEHLPASPLLLGVMVLINLVLYGAAYRTLLIPQMADPPVNWPLQLVAGTFITLLWFKVTFQLAGKNERFVQTMVAVFAVNTVFIAVIPLVAVLLPHIGAKSVPASVGFISLLVFAVAVWALMVLARIVRSAFEWSWAVAVLFVIASNFGAAILLSIVFGTPPKSG